MEFLIYSHHFGHLDLFSYLAERHWAAEIRVSISLSFEAFWEISTYQCSRT